MAWLCAEYVADELLRAGALVEPGSLEYRAGRRTLALTVYLGDGTGDTPGGAEDRLEEWLTRTAHGHPWKEWVRERLDGAPEPGGEDPDADLTLARETWRLLESTHLLATDLGALSAGGPADGVMVDESDRTWLPSWQVGLPLGHLALRLY